MTSEGFLNLNEIVRIVVGELNLQVDDVNKLNIKQIYMLQQSRLEHYEMLAHSVRAGYASAMTGKPINMFGKQEETSKPETQSKANPKAQIEKLDQIFGK